MNRDIPTRDHSEGSDARPRDTLDRDVESAIAPSTSAPAKSGDPVVDEKGRPISGDGVTKKDAPVARPSQAEQLPPDD